MYRNFAEKGELYGMLKRKLCSDCKIGKYSYELDTRSTHCPYVRGYNGDGCTMFERLKRFEKDQIRNEKHRGVVGKSSSV